MAHPSLAIANKILQTATERGVSLTNMQLIKLAYIAHGWSLALLGRPLIAESPEAWQHGPVYPSVYRKFRDAGWGPVERLAVNDFTGTPYEAELDHDEQAVIDKVVDGYGNIHAFSLSARTHKAGTPWSTVWNGGAGKFRPIPDDLIKAHYLDISRQNA